MLSRLLQKRLDQGLALLSLEPLLALAQYSLYRNPKTRKTPARHQGVVVIYC